MIIDNFGETVLLISTMEKAQPLVGRKVRTVYQTVHGGYERLARYDGKGATQREAELCVLI